MGAMVPEALAAADRLAQIGVPADVVCVTSPGLLFEAVRARQGHEQAESWILDQVFPAERRHLWSPSSTAIRTPSPSWPPSTVCLSPSLGVTRFGQSGSLDDVYRYHGIDTDSIVRAALDLTD